MTQRPTSLNVHSRPLGRTAAVGRLQRQPRILHRIGTWPAIGALLLANGFDCSESRAAPNVCGEPPLQASSESAVLLWQDCATGLWTLTATAGGSQFPVSHAGTLTSDQSPTTVVRRMLEGGDVVDTSSSTNIDFDLNVFGSWYDAFDFRYPSAADVCLDLTTSSARLLVGPGRTPVTTPFNLRTLGACGSTVASTCGAPSYDASRDAGTFLWRDCDTGQWSFRITGGNSSSYTQSSGSIVADGSFSSVTPFSLESNDALSTPSSGRVEYDLIVGGVYEDGLDFRLSGTSSACLDTGSGDSQVFVGPGRVAVRAPFDVLTLGSCDAGVGGTTPAPSPSPTPAPSPAPDQYPYLSDAETGDSTTSSVPSDIDDQPWPRLSTGDTKGYGTAQQFSKYDVIHLKGFSFGYLRDVQAIDPNVKGFRFFCPLEYQGWTESSACYQGSGMPFGGTGPSTQGCNVFAGHWLYAPGSTLRSSISAGATTLQVADASRFTAGRYVVIYDGGAGAFRNAEHVRVQSVNRSTNTLTLAARGYKSSALSHPAGSVVAEHVLGNGEAQNPLNWAYNLSTSCPRDGSGRTLGEVMAAWLAENYDLGDRGNVTGAKIQGILFDSDFHFIEQSGHNKQVDVNNDLTLDDGLAADGTNLWGEGLDRFYRLLRQRLPNTIITGGVTEARGYDSLNGTQLEGFPKSGNFNSAVPDYRDLDGKLSAYLVNMYDRSVGPRYTELSSKMPTLAYPDQADVRPTSNAPFRFSFGLALMNDGYFSQENWNTRDAWYDEYAVDVVRGSSTFGRAIASNPNDESAIRRHKGWMGYPSGLGYRVYDKAAFAPEKNLLSGGDFDSALGSWSGQNVSVSRDTSRGNFLDGSGAMHISRQRDFSASKEGAQVIGPSVRLTAGKQYTLAFAAKSSEPRTMQAAVGWQSVQKMDVPDRWVRRVVTFEATGSGNYNIRFEVGRESTEVWIDSVYLFEGNANVFRRDFDNAVVVVNATPSARTIALGETLRRIRGTGQDPINNGATLTQVTIAPYDAAILVRP